MYGFWKAFPDQKELIRVLMERSTQMMNEECIRPMMELSGVQQKQILDFCADCIAPDGDMTGFVQAACRSQLKGDVIHQLNSYQKGKRKNKKEVALPQASTFISVL